jgi:acetyl-CoA acetyltransferase
MAAGIPQEATAWGLNQLCGSGLRAVALGMQQIMSGDADIIVAGGQESMSMAPHTMHLRGGVKMGDAKMVDTMMYDALTDAFHKYLMGTTAENVAKQWQLTRDEQDDLPSTRRTRPKRRKRPASSRTRSLRTPSRAARAIRWWTRMSTSSTA